MDSRKAVVVVVITVAWAAILLGVRHVAETAATAPAQQSLAAPQVRMIVRHAGCREQGKEIPRALAALTWLGEARVEPESAAPSGPGPEMAPAPHTLARAPAEEGPDPCTVRVLAPVKEVEQVDFMRLLATLRDIGVVPAVLEFGGLPRFGFQARLPDLTCPTCAQAALEALKPFPVSAAYYYSTTKNPVEVSKQVALRWVEGKSVDPARNTITVSVVPGQVARVDEMIRALERAGLLPLALRVVAEKA
jgi:hypothetical protein